MYVKIFRLRGIFCYKDYLSNFGDFYMSILSFQV